MALSAALPPKKVVDPGPTPEELRLEEARYDAFTVMIVLNVEDRVVGIVVDSVSDVIPLSAEQIAASSSTSGYCAEIFTPQCRQRPRSAR